MPGHRDRLIGCRDLAGRRGHIIVLVDHGRIVFIAPAGETAVLTPVEVGQLRAALREAVIDAVVEAAATAAPGPAR